MPNQYKRKWSPDIVEKVRLMTDDGASNRTIGQALDITAKQVNKIREKNNILCYNPKSISQTCPYDIALQREPALEAERNKIWHKYKGKKMTWLNLADLHCPFYDKGLWAEALEVKADGVILSEVFDFYSLSVFRKDQFISIKDEINWGIELLGKLKKRFKNIVWFEANHERRLWKRMQDVLGKDTQGLELIEVYQLSPPIPKKLAELEIDSTTSWWCKLGKVIFAHPDWFSQIQLRTAENTLDYFLKELGVRGCSEIDAIVNHHTHAQAKGERYGIALYESGCCSTKMDYTREGRKRLHTHKGYMLIRIEADGSLNENETRLIRYRG